MSRHLELMKLADGELEPDVAEKLSAELTDEELALLEGVEQIGDFVSVLADHQAGVADDIADRVMAKIDEDEPRPALRGIPGGAEREPTAMLEPGERRAQVLFISGVVLAAAAAVLLWVSFQSESSTRSPVAQVPTAGVPVATPSPVAGRAAPAVQAAQEDEAAPAASIEAVDFGNQAGSIFMVPAGEETTPVVWLVDDAPGGRMEPL
jgi:negative regulator of sigma E activity